jgi:putative transcriptional regulator
MDIMKIVRATRNMPEQLVSFMLRECDMCPAYTHQLFRTSSGAHTVIRFRLTELIAEKSFREGRRVELGEVADATGIHRSTLSRIVNIRGANVTAANMDRLCGYFRCSLGELAEYVPDESLRASEAVSAPPRRRAAAKAAVVKPGGVKRRRSGDS